MPHENNRNPAGRDRTGDQHLEWLLNTVRKAAGTQSTPVNRLLNLAVQECADWLIEHVDAQIKVGAKEVNRIREHAMPNDTNSERVAVGHLVSSAMGSVREFPRACRVA